MKLREVYEHDREEILSEMKDAPTNLAFYITKEGDNRCVFTDLCVPLCLFLLVVLSRNIEVYDFMKKVFDTLEKYRDEPVDPKKHIIEG